MNRRQLAALMLSASLTTVLVTGCGTGGSSEPNGSTGSETPTAAPSEDDEGGTS